MQRIKFLARLHKLALPSGQCLEDEQLIIFSNRIIQGLAVFDQFSLQEDVHVFPKLTAVLDEVIQNSRVRLLNLLEGFLHRISLNVKLGKVGEEAI
jgi:hypothetical protein